MWTEYDSLEKAGAVEELRPDSRRAALLTKAAVLQVGRVMRLLVFTIQLIHYPLHWIGSYSDQGSFFTPAPTTGTRKAGCEN